MSPPRRPTYHRDVGSNVAVTVSDVIRRFDQVTAVDGVSLTVSTGTVTAILGPNGAGKTTLLDMITGFTAPDAGRIRTLGADPRSLTRDQRARIGVMLQQGGVWSAAKPREVISHVAGLYAQPWDVTEIMERLDLHRVATTPFRRLSGGEKQRTSLACAIVGHPDIAFLDEPTAGLDPHARRSVWELIAELAAGGTTVVLSTHLIDEAELLAAKVIILHRGRVVADAAPADLTASGQGEEIRLEGPSGLPRDELLAALPQGASVTEGPPGRYRVRAHLDAQSLAATSTWWVSHGGDMGRMTLRRTSLEDVFLDLTRGQEPQ